jgi:hypothetical protein
MRQISCVILAVALGGVAVSCTTEKVVPQSAAVQKAALPTDPEAETIVLAKAILEYLATPEEQSTENKGFIARMIKKARSNPDIAEVQVYFYSAGHPQYGHYDLNTKVLTMGDAHPEKYGNRISLSLENRQFITCSIDAKRLDLTVTKAPDGRFSIKVRAAWTIG